MFARMIESGLPSLSMMPGGDCQGNGGTPGGDCSSDGGTPGGNCNSDGGTPGGAAMM